MEKAIFTVLCSLTGAISLQIYAPVLESQLMRVLRLHHTVMYIFFGLLGVTRVLGSTINSFPISLTKLALSNAFLVQGKYQYLFFSGLFSTIRHLGNFLEGTFDIMV